MTATDVEDVCDKMLKSIQKHAPVICPRVLPHGYCDNDLVALCKNEDEKKALRDLIQRAGQNVFKCTIPNCGAKGTVTTSDQKQKDDELVFTTQWSIDFFKKTYVFNRAEFLCSNCRTLFDLEAFLNLSTQTSTENQKKLKVLIQHFLRLNGADEGDVGLVQETYAKAFSLKVLSSNIPSISVEQVKIDKLEDILKQKFAHRPEIKLFEESNNKKTKKQTEAASSNKNKNNNSNSNKNAAASMKDKKRKHNDEEAKTEPEPEKASDTKASTHNCNNKKNKNKDKKDQSEAKNTTATTTTSEKKADASKKNDDEQKQHQQQQQAQANKASDNKDTKKSKTAAAATADNKSTSEESEKQATKPKNDNKKNNKKRTKDEAEEEKEKSTAAAAPAPAAEDNKTKNNNNKAKNNNNNNSNKKQKREK